LNKLESLEQASKKSLAALIFLLGKRQARVILRGLKMEKYHYRQRVQEIYTQKCAAVDGDSENTIRCSSHLII